MREIKKIEMTGNSNVQPKQDLSKVEKTGPQLPLVEEDSSIQNFSNPSAEASGRFHVSKTDNVKEDVNFGMAHPETIERSEKLFNLALAQLQAKNDPNAYEKACAISTSSYARDLLNR